MEHSFTHETERYRYATRDDLPAFAELLSDPEVGRWLWFTPIPPDGVEAFFGPFLDRQVEELAATGTPQTAVFVVEDLDGEFLGQGAVVEVDASPKGFEVGFQLMRKAWGRGVGTRRGDAAWGRAWASSSAPTPSSAATPTGSKAGVSMAIPALRRCCGN